MSALTSTGLRKSVPTLLQARLSEQLGIPVALPVRNYQVGDVLLLRAFDRSTNTFSDLGAIVRRVLVKVTNITAPGSYGLPADIGVMSISVIADT